MRLFIAFELPDSFLDSLEKDCRTLKQQHPEIRWTPRENLHLTAVFLGEVAEEHLPEIQHTIEHSLTTVNQTTSTHGIPIHAEGIYTFPERRPASVLAIGIHEEENRIQQITSNLEKALLTLSASTLPGRQILPDFSPSRRPFVPHITTGRAGRQPIRLQPEEKNIVFTAQGTIITLTLFSSILQRGGPVYTAIKRWRV